MSNPDLLQQALLHPSWANERGLEGNGRLEFLGDAVLSSVVAKMLYRLFPESPEGWLTRARSDITCNRALADAAVRAKLHLKLRMGGKGTIANGDLSDTFEAYVGALFLKSGFDEAEVFILRYVDLGLIGANRNYVGDLQEKVQKSGGPVPEYLKISSVGEGINKWVEMAVLVNGIDVAHGYGINSKEARVDAAMRALRTME